MENLTELKQFVFALYIGQKVMKWENPVPEDSTFVADITGGMIEAYANECYLQLRPLSSITDQEAIEVAKLFVKHEYKETIVFCDSNRKATLVLFSGDTGDTLSTVYICNDGNIIFESYEYEEQPLITLFAYQYLQQQGFALPVYFKGVQYSVEKLIELGIYQIK